MKNTLLAILLALCVFPAYAQSDGPTIRFGVDPTFAPYESVDHGKMVGIDIELGNAICEHLNATCKWVKINFDGAIPALKAKKIDVILSAMTITGLREKQVLFSIPMYYSPSRLMVPKGVTLDTTAESLKGKRVGIVQGTSQAAYANKFWKGKGVDLVSYENDAVAKQDLAMGRVDATLQDVVAANAYIADTAQGKNFHLVGTPVHDPETFGKGVGIAMRKSDTKLKKEIDSALNAMKEDGSYQKILAHYHEKYGMEPPQKDD